MLIEAFFAEFAIEALDVAILHRPARFDQNVADTVTLCPRHEGSAGEFRAIVGAHCAQTSAKYRRPIQKPSYILA